MTNVDLDHLEIACALAAVRAVADSAPFGPPPTMATTRDKLEKALRESREARENSRAI
jgi:hypothetical protein